MTSVFSLASRRNLIIDGLWGSGKSLLLSLCQAIPAQPWVFSAELDHIPPMYAMGQITHDGARALLYDYFNTHSYYSFIGRNQNMRFDDLSCVLRRPGRVRNLCKLISTDKLVRSFDRKSRELVNVYVTHMSGINNSLLEDCFGDSTLTVNCIRHPAMMLNHWADYFDYISFSDPRESTLKFSYAGQLLPFFALGWEEQYLRSSSLEKAIYAIAKLYALLLRKVRSGCSSSFLLVNFEEVASRPCDVVSMVSNSLGCGHSRNGLQKLIQKNKLPRASDRLQVDGFWAARQTRCRRQITTLESVESLIPEIVCDDCASSYLDAVNDYQELTRLTSLAQ